VIKVDPDEQGLETAHWSSLWGAVYGNLMTCVAIFFLLMFISAKSSLFQQAIDAIAAQFGGAPGARRGGNVISAYAVDQISKLDIKESRMKIIFGAPVLFDSGRAELKPSALPQLERLADTLKQVPNPVQIEGHTDNQALAPGSPYHSNWELSAARAFAVLKYLQKEGVPPARLSAIGYGEWKPLKPNDTLEHRAINRRIEIELVRMDD
jgi:flagellar motor protein MotB